MLETALVAFTTFFATVGPPDVAAVFAALAVQFVFDGIMAGPLSGIPAAP